ncbi:MULTISPECIES: penicillin-binding protein [Bacillus]|uniref:penicillin-binding protein n=1 Tax=Bacillus TaxID=1386 RepID=UPI000BB952BD|nr:MULTISPECIES: penicillin-binding protein [Bacillus]
MKVFIHKKRIHYGAAILSGLFTLLFFVFIGRFFVLQVTGEVRGENLSDYAEGKYNVTYNINAERGSILDRNGNPIAEDMRSFKMVAVLDESLSKNQKKLRHVADPITTAQKLAPLLNVEESELIERLSREGAKQVEFGAYGRDIPILVKEEIEELDLPGISFIEGSKRFYANGIFASHVIGFARESDSGEVSGVLGIEKMLEDHLKEENGKLTQKRDMSRLRLPFVKDSDTAFTPKKDGQDVYLTIDKTIQTFLEEAMSKVQDAYTPERIIGIVAEPKTGKILAMSTRPTFDLNTREGLNTNWNNDAISYRFEPGSTMKVFSLAAAIEEGVYNGSELFKSGSFPIPSAPPIYDHNRAGWGEITFDEGVQRSSNVAFALLTDKMGTDTLMSYLSSFGLDAPTGIDLPDETSSILNFQWYRDRISTAFGQGSAFTPIQLVQAATAIANDGKMMQPYIIDRIVDVNNGEVVLDNVPKVKGEPISEQTAKKVRGILETVVTSDVGTGRPYRLEGYNIAMKTGTAQISSSTGGWLTGHGEHIYSALGMAPTENPEIIVYVAVERPTIAEYESGAVPVSSIFNAVMLRSLQYLSIKRTDETPSETSIKNNIGFETDDYIGKNISEIENNENGKQTEIVVIGNGNQVMKQVPYPGKQIIQGEKVFLLTEEDTTMLDMTGWSLRDVLKYASLIGVSPRVIGNGYVTSQSVEPGKKFKSGTQLVIEFSSNRPIPPLNEEENSGVN